MAEADEGRHAVFISHGNPQDNDFTIWLGTRLAILGYEVWSDLTRLIGGEETWQNIDQAIRHQAALVILVLARPIFSLPRLSRLPPTVWPPAGNAYVKLSPSSGRLLQGPSVS